MVFILYWKHPLSKWKNTCKFYCSALFKLDNIAFANSADSVNRLTQITTTTFYTLKQLTGYFSASWATKMFYPYKIYLCSNHGFTNPAYIKWPFLCNFVDELLLYCLFCWFSRGAVNILQLLNWTVIYVLSKFLTFLISDDKLKCSW